MSELEMDPAKFPHPPKRCYDRIATRRRAKAKASAVRMSRCSTIPNLPNGSRRSASI